jgi:phosphate acyltransferase
VSLDAQERSAPTIVIALDAMGGDRAPAEPVRGALAVAGPELHVALVGDGAILRDELAIQDGPSREWIEIVHAAEVIGSEEDGARAVRAKPEASVAVATRLVGEGRAQAVVSPGHTGATLAAATLYLRRVPGVLRPGIAVVVPSLRGPVVLIDAGANAEARPEHLEQFALMGRLFARDVLLVSDPRVGLLSIGEEDERGSDLVQGAHALLRGTEGFVGNIEGRDISSGVVDVVVTDGFTGNVALKLMEGTAEFVVSQVRAAFGSSLPAKVGGLLARPALRRMGARLDPNSYGGAYLLGVRGLSVIGHGNARADGVANALRLAARGARENLVDRLAEGLARESAAPRPAA